MNKKKDKDIFSDLSDILGIDIYKIVVNKDEEEINRLKRKLLKDSIKIRTQSIYDTKK